MAMMGRPRRNSLPEASGARYAYRRRAGVTLLEMIFALAIGIIVILGFNLMLISSIRLGDISYEKGVVTFDMNAVVGHVRQQPLASLLDPEYEDAQGGPRVPHGGVVSHALYRHPDDPAAGQAHLPEQEIIVYYMGDDGHTLPLPGDKTDPINTHTLTVPFETPDPLTFVVQCTWVDRNEEDRTERMPCVRSR